MHSTLLGKEPSALKIDESSASEASLRTFESIADVVELWQYWAHEQEQYHTPPSGYPYHIAEWMPSEKSKCKMTILDNK